MCRNADISTAKQVHIPFHACGRSLIQHAMGTAKHRTFYPHTHPSQTTHMPTLPELHAPWCVGTAPPLGLAEPKDGEGEGRGDGAHPSHDAIEPATLPANVNVWPCACRSTHNALWCVEALCSSLHNTHNTTFRNPDAVQLLSALRASLRCCAHGVSLTELRAVSVSTKDYTSSIATCELHDHELFVVSWPTYGSSAPSTESGGEWGEGWWYTPSPDHC